jgi:hypothetical protein
MKNRKLEKAMVSSGEKLVYPRENSRDGEFHEKNGQDGQESSRRPL